MNDVELNAVHSKTIDHSNSFQAASLAMEQALAESPGDLSWGKTVGAADDKSIADLVPLLQQYGVDVYAHTSRTITIEWGCFACFVLLIS